MSQERGDIAYAYLTRRQTRIGFDRPGPHRFPTPTWLDSCWEPDQRQYKPLEASLQPATVFALQTFPRWARGTRLGLKRIRASVPEHHLSREAPTTIPCAAYLNAHRARAIDQSRRPPSAHQKQARQITVWPVLFLVPPGRFERPTPALGERCSIP